MNFIERHLFAYSAVFVFMLAIAAYWFTLAPTVTFVDSGELISAAYALGVAHPPGTPLHTLLAHVATLFPFGNVAERVNFLSALFGALAAAAMVSLISEIMLSASYIVRPEKRPKKARRPKVRESSVAEDTKQERRIFPFEILTSILFGGILFAFSNTLWTYSTIAEVYTLNIFLIISVFALVFRWRRMNLLKSAAAVTSPSARSALYFSAFLFGLALGVHHVTVLLMLPALAFVVLKTEGLRFLGTKQILYSALFAVAGLGIYLYLPLAASRSPLINWGDPRSAESLLRHVSGWQYQTFFSFSLERMAGQFTEFVDLAASQSGTWSGLLVFALIVAGIYRLWRTDRIALCFVLIVIAADLLIALNYEIAEDKDAYYLPGFAAFVLLASFGAQWLITTLASFRLQPGYAHVLATFIFLVILEGVFVENLRNNNRSQFSLADDYVQNIYRSMDPNGVLLTTDWQVYSPCLYKTTVEGARPDLAIIDVNQLRRSWYFDYVDRVYPDLMQPNRDKEAAFLDDLRRWEKDPSRYNADISLARRIDGRFRDLIASMVASQSGKRKVYITQEIGELFSTIAARRAGNKEIDPASIDKDGPWVASLADNYSIVPRGLIFELSAEKQIQLLPNPDLEIRGLRDAVLRLAPNDVVRQKVIPVYLKMAMNRGLFLLNAGHIDGAKREFDQALDIDPSFAPAKQAAAQLENRKLAK